MSTEAQIQLPADATANKNLLRAFTVLTGGSTTGTQNSTMVQAIALGDADGNLVSAWNGLATADAETRALLGNIVDRLDILIGLIEK